MTYHRFAQLYHALILDAPPVTNPLIVQEGSSPRLCDALCAASNGDFSHFDELDARMEEYDLR